MTPERWRRLEAAFEGALELERGARPAFLDEACSDDAELRAEVEAMLRATQVDHQPIRDAIAAEAQEVWESPAADRRIGPYRITGLLGRGGMGAVYAAVRDDRVFSKQVAIKVLRGEFVEGSAALERFRQERQILGSLDHRNIARVLDGGETPVPYLVMEKIDGAPFTSHCRTLPIDARVRLFLKICDAVQFAHGRFVVHRDLKPKNILVTPEGEPKLLDFGIAKLLDAAGNKGLTETECRVLTPAYASPEQFRGETITTASDVYSLGAVLYEALAGEPPLRIEGLPPAEADRIVNFVDPRLPSEVAPAGIRREIKGDLDNITLMALRKDPARRYQSAENLATDLRRYLEGRTVSARPDTVIYRSSRFLRRHAWGAAAIGVIAASLLAGALVSLHQARIAQTRFREMRQLVNKFLFDFDDSIRDLRGATRSRELVVGTALDYLGRLSQQSGNDPELLADLAAAYKKVGDVQGNPSIASLGRTDEALESYLTSARLWEQVRAARPRDTRALVGLSAALGMAGEIYRSKENAEQTRHYYERAADAANAAAGEAPSDGETVYASATSWFRLGDLRFESGQGAAAKHAFERSLELFRKSAAVRGTDRDRNAVALALSRLGAVAIADNQPAESLRFHQESLAIREDLAQRNPNVASFQRGVGSELNLIGALYGSTQNLNLGDLPAAEKAFRRSLAIHQKLAAADPNNRTAQIDVVLMNMRLCETLAGLRSADAIPFCDKAIQMGVPLNAGTGRKDVLEFAAVSEIAEASAELQMGKPETAIHFSEAAMAHLDTVGPKARLNYSLNMMRGAIVLGDAFLAMHDAPRARAAWAKARALPAGDQASPMQMRQILELDRRLAEVAGEDRAKWVADQADVCGKYRRLGLPAVIGEVPKACQPSGTFGKSP